MQALLLTSVHQLRLVERPQLTAAPGEVVLTTKACGICRTDAVLWQQGHRDLVLPRVPGHEVCGYVADDPSRLYAVWPGDACGTCQLCRDGRENLCSSAQIIGFHRDGGFAEELLVPRRSLIELPATLHPDLATLAEPLACALGALDRVRLAAGDRTLVFGAGTLGMLLAFAAAERGAEVVLTDIDAGKLERSGEFRRKFAIGTIEPGNIPPAGTFDIALNAASAPAILPAALESLKSGGRCCIFSGVRGDVEGLAPALLREVHYREIELSGSYGCTRRNMQAALQLLDTYADSLAFFIADRVSLTRVPDLLPLVLSGSRFRYVINF